MFTPEQRALLLQRHHDTIGAATGASLRAFVAREERLVAAIARDLKLDRDLATDLRLAQDLFTADNNPELFIDHCLSEGLELTPGAGKHLWTVLHRATDELQMLWQREDDHLTPLPVTNGDGGRELEFLRQMTLLSATGAGGIALAGINAGLDQTWPSVSGALQSLQLMDRVQLAYTGCPTVNALRLHANCLPSRMRLEWRKEMQKGCELPEIADDFLYAAGMREVRQRAVDRLQETDGRYRPEHVARVVNTALDIACTSQTPVCKSAVYLGALLHDVQKHLDMAHGVGVLHPQAGAVWAENALQKAGINDRKFILKVQNCIAAHSPEISSWVPPTAKSLEAKIVSDADRLDSLGAINILKGFYLLGFNIRSQKPIGRYGFSAVTTVQEALDAVMKDGETQVAQLQTDGGIWLGQHRLKDMQKIATSLKWELHYEA